MIKGPCKLPEKHKDRGFITEYFKIGVYDYKGKIFEDLPNRGIFEVSIKEAIDFCKWLGGYLPKENEFEAICTNFGETIYPWGNEYVEEKINEGLPLDSEKLMGIAKNEIYVQNTEGIMNIIGYLNEMTQSCFDKNGNFYEEYNENCTDIIVKGGSFYNSYVKLNCKTSSRISIDGDFSAGFRCIKKLK